jgi:hypothetical protein
LQPLRRDGPDAGEVMTAEEQVIDAQVVDEGSTALVAQRRSEVLRPLDVTDQKAAMDLYQAGLQQILDPSDWQDAGRNEKFVKKSGWRKIAAWFDLSIELVSDHVDRDENGQIIRAQVWARAVAATGRFADGDGYCDASEKRFGDARGRQKLENDLRGTATTRAVNRAISNLVGMGAVSAEEVDGPPSAAGRPMGETATEDAEQAAKLACGVLAEGNVDQAVDMYRKIVSDCGGYLPASAALTLSRVASLVRS